jgi:hypothetical protein
MTTGRPPGLKNKQLKRFVENREEPQKYNSKKGLVSLDPKLPLPKGRCTKAYRRKVLKRNAEILGIRSKDFHNTVSLTETLQLLLSLVDPLVGLTEGQKLMVKLVEIANRGDLDAIKEVFNRMDGKVIERHELRGDMPISIIFRPVESQPALPSVESECIELLQEPQEKPSETFTTIA